MDGITRHTPFDDLFNELTKGFWVKPLAVSNGAKAEYKDGVLTLSLPKKGNGGGKRLAVA